MKCELFDDLVVIDMNELSPKQWAGALLISFREGGLAAAVQLIRLAPPDVAAQLSACLEDALPQVLAGANDP